MEKDREWWLKLITGVVFFGGWLFLLILRKSKPDTDLSTAFYIILAVSVFCVVGFFSKDIKKSLNKEEKMKVISKEDIYNKILDHAHEKRHNNLRSKNPIVIFDQDTVGSDIIYAYKVYLNLDNESFIMIINASFEEREPVFLDIEADSVLVREIMNRLARKPNNHTTEEKTEENMLTGNKVTLKKTIPFEEKKENNAI